jgi:hypothetical protein
VVTLRQAAKRLLLLPILVAKWLIVVVATLVWLTLVPIVDLVRELIDRLLRRESELR